MNIGIVYNSFANKNPLPEEKEMRETGLSIGKHLSRLGYRVRYFDMDNPHSIEALCACKLEVAINACERIHDDARGEVYAAALLEFLGIPHTRTSSWLIALGISKARVKSILSYYHINTPRFQIFKTAEEELDGCLQFPLFVKCQSCENSIGIDQNSLVQDRKQLHTKVNQILDQFHQPALVEEYIDGREFSVAILPGRVDHVLPISEIVFRDLPPERRFLDYDSKWMAATEAYQKTVPVCPARLTEPERRVISATALRCFKILGLDSYARIDMRYRDNIPYVLEVNQNPSISEEGSGYVRTCTGFGLDYAAMINVLLRNAIVRKSEGLSARTARPGSDYRSKDTADLFLFGKSRL